MKKEDFISEHENVIITWATAHQHTIQNYESYRWLGSTYEQSTAKRNDLEDAIRQSRRKHGGGIDLDTLDNIWRWGFGKNTCFPTRDATRVFDVTRSSLHFLDTGDCYQACKGIMPITFRDPHPSGATKILGLSDQERFCIYDHRVGKALDTLRENGTKIILCPSEDKIDKETALDGWAREYQKLIWTLETIRDLFIEQGKRHSISQLEMALFMMGRSNNP